MIHDHLLAEQIRDLYMYRNDTKHNSNFLMYIIETSTIPQRCTGIPVLHSRYRSLFTFKSAQSSHKNMHIVTSQLKPAWCLVDYKSHISERITFILIHTCWCCVIQDNHQNNIEPWHPSPIHIEQAWHYRQKCLYADFYTTWLKATCLKLNGTNLCILMTACHLILDFPLSP